MNYQTEFLYRYQWNECLVWFTSAELFIVKCQSSTRFLRATRYKYSAFLYLSNRKLINRRYLTESVDKINTETYQLLWQPVDSMHLQFPLTLLHFLPTNKMPMPTHNSHATSAIYLTQLLMLLTVKPNFWDKHKTTNLNTITNVHWEHTPALANLLLHETSQNP